MNSWSKGKALENRGSLICWEEGSHSKRMKFTCLNYAACGKWILSLWVSYSLYVFIFRTPCFAVFACLQILVRPPQSVMWINTRMSQGTRVEGEGGGRGLISAWGSPPRHTAQAANNMAGTTISPLSTSWSGQHPVRSGCNVSHIKSKKGLTGTVLVILN